MPKEGCSRWRKVMTGDGREEIGAGSVRREV